MNEHIKPIFEIVLPRIQYENIKYWIYGGVANAAVVGECYRSNPDVDLFCLEEDFEKVEHLLQILCKENTWKVCKTFLKGRPKLEIFILKNGKKWIERLSIVPAYIKNNQVELKFREGSGEYPLNFLQQTERQLDSFTFYTISNDFLEQLFTEYLESKKEYPTKRIEDVRKLLTEEKFKKYFPNENYDQDI